MPSEEKVHFEEISKDCGCKGFCGTQPPQIIQDEQDESKPSDELVGVPPEELKVKLEELFSAARKEIPSPPGDLLLPEVDPTEFEKRQLPNGMFITVRKTSDLTAEKLAGMVEGVDAIEIDSELCESPSDDGPAKSDYKPGQLRHLKSKLYPDDNSGEEAQTRLKARQAVRDAFGTVPLTNHTTTVIENPSLVRRGIRAIRRTWNHCVAWWLL